MKHLIVHPMRRSLPAMEHVMHNPTHHSWVWIIIFAFFLVHAYRIDQVVATEKTLADRISAFIKSESGVDTHHAVRALFIEASDQELSELIHNKIDRIAVYAAWESVSRKIDRSNGLSSLVDEKRMSGEIAGWFEGFIEGRLRTAPPNKWMAAIKSAEFFNDRSFQIAENSFWKPNQLSDPKTAAELAHAKANRGTAIRGVRNHVSIAISSVELKKILEETRVRQFDAATIEAEADTVVAVLSNNFSLAVVRIDAKSGKILWTRRIDTVKGGGSGLWAHAVECAIKDERVFLFGVTSLSCYIYMLDTTTGELELDFDSTGL